MRKLLGRFINLDFLEGQCKCTVVRNKLTIHLQGYLRVFMCRSELNLKEKSLKTEERKVTLAIKPLVKSGNRFLRAEC